VKDAGAPFSFAGLWAATGLAASEVIAVMAASLAAIEFMKTGRLC
jgi:hypothetical protein